MGLGCSLPYSQGLFNNLYLEPNQVNIRNICNLHYKIKLNLWLTAPKGATSVDHTSETDWQMAVGRDGVTTITLRQLVPEPASRV